MAICGHSCLRVRALFGCELEHTAGPVVEFIVIYIVGVRHLEVRLHQEGSTVGFAFAWQWLVVDAVEFTDGVVLVGVKTSHLDARYMLVLHRLEFPPEEDSLLLVFAYIHQRGEIVASIRGMEAIEVAELDDGAYALVVGDDDLLRRQLRAGRNA